MPHLSEAATYLKNYVRSNTPAGYIDGWALRLMDADDEDEAEIGLRNTCFEEFLKHSPEVERPMAFSVSFAFASVVHDRIIEIRAAGVGHA